MLPWSRRATPTADFHRRRFLRHWLRLRLPCVRGRRQPSGRPPILRRRLRHRLSPRRFSGWPPFSPTSVLWSAAHHPTSAPTSAFWLRRQLSGRPQIFPSFVFAVTVSSLRVNPLSYIAKILGYISCFSPAMEYDIVILIPLQLSGLGDDKRKRMPVSIRTS